MIFDVVDIEEEEEEKEVVVMVEGLLLLEETVEDSIYISSLFPAPQNSDASPGQMKLQSP